MACHLAKVISFLLLLGTVGIKGQAVDSPKNVLYDDAATKAPCAASAAALCGLEYSAYEPVTTTSEAAQIKADDAERDLITCLYGKLKDLDSGCRSALTGDCCE